MHILYYSWLENSKVDMIDALSFLGHQVSLITAPVDNYLVQPELENTIFQTATDYHCDFIFSFNYFPFLAQAAERARLPYVSWIYDCPHWTLFSPTIASPYNYLFLFDLSLVELAKTNGAVHAVHLPLAVNTNRINKLLSKPSDCHETISFVGSLYENNPFQRLSYLPKQLRGYIDGILAAQSKIYGQDLLYHLLTPELLQELAIYIKTEQNPLCPIPDKQFFLSMLQAELTSRERISSINALSNGPPVSLYSLSDASLCPKAFFKGSISYATEMPFVFAHSDINLNITLRSITSGIPLRALDIMGCGGFLLTNYQPELDLYFFNGSDYIYFNDTADLLQKTDYYLSHPKERTEIAANGLRRVTSDFSYEHQINQMLSLL